MSRIGGTLTTRDLLTCAAFGTVGAALGLAISPATGALAAAAPPLYAVVAGAYSVMPVAARMFTGMTGSTTITAGVGGLLLIAVSPLGMLALVPLLLSAAVIDAALWAVGRRNGNTVAGWAAAAIASAVLLFVVSLTVFSAAHLTAGFVIGALAGRLVGQTAAVAALGDEVWVWAGDTVTAVAS